MNVELSVVLETNELPSSPREPQKKQEIESAKTCFQCLQETYRCHPSKSCAYTYLGTALGLGLITAVFLVAVHLSPAK